MFMNLNQRMTAGRLPAGGSALQQLEVLARGIAAAERITKEQAMTKAAAKRPDLYESYLNQQGDEAKARAEKRRAEEQEIRELVALAGFPPHTAEAAIKDGSSPAQVRAALLRGRRTEYRA